jgi:clan AA aspartic protease (TIGR02281 family)
MNSSVNPTPAKLSKAMPIRRAAAVLVLFVAALIGTALRPVRAETVALMRERGAFVLPVVINDRITRNFMIDSGASDVTISADVIAALTRAGTIARTDVLVPQVYQLADGSKTRTERVRIRSLRIGSVELRDVVVSVAPHAGFLLLGQSFLGRLQSWAIDNQHHLFVLNEALTQHPVATPVARHETTREAAAESDDWLSIGQSKDGLQRLYFNRSSVLVKDGIPRAWFKTIYSPHTVKGFERRDKWMSAVLSRDAFNCDEQTGRTEEAKEYYDDGTHYAVPAAQLRASWRSVGPGTGFNKEMGIMCRLAGVGPPRRLSSNLP